MERLSAGFNFFIDNGPIKLLEGFFWVGFSGDRSEFNFWVHPL